MSRWAAQSPFPLRLLAATVLFALLLTGMPQPAVAMATAIAPRDLCAAQTAAAEAVQAKIIAHNAKPHVFQLPRQAAALAAYNAEAAALEADRATVLANLQTCIAAMTALAAESQTSLKVNAVPEKDRLAIDAAKKQVPDSFVPPPPPPTGKNWTVPKGSPLRPLYDILREDNPGAVGNATLRGSPRPRVGAPDPAYPTSTGRTFGTNAAGGSAASPDHIIPLAEIVNMPGFTRLKAEYMYVVTRAPVNYQWLSRGANSAKQSRSVAGMSGVDPVWQAEQIALEQEVRAKLQDIINKLLTIQG